MPNNIEDLKTLPGIGDYTSRAIMAIAFNKPYIPLDGNVERILKRIFYLKIRIPHIFTPMHFSGYSICKIVTPNIAPMKP